MKQRTIYLNLPTKITVGDLLSEMDAYGQDDGAMIDLALGLLNMADDNEKTKRNARVAKWLGVKLP